MSMKLIITSSIGSRLFAYTRTVVLIASTSLALFSAGSCHAQAQETDGKVYTAEVVQIDGTKKTIQYKRDARGAIIAPAVLDGKLVDGSTAPENAVEARVAQKKILAKYDQNAMLMLAAVSKDDILSEANKTTGEILDIAEQGRSISKKQLFDGFYSAYIFNLGFGNGKADRTISGLETIARITLKLGDSEITQIKQDAKTKATVTWVRVTGAVLQ